MSRRWGPLQLGLPMGPGADVSPVAEHPRARPWERGVWSWALFKPGSALYGAHELGRVTLPGCCVHTVTWRTWPSPRGHQLRLWSPGPLACHGALCMQQGICRSGAQAALEGTEPHVQLPRSPAEVTWASLQESGQGLGVWGGRQRSRDPDPPPAQPSRPPGPAGAAVTECPPCALVPGAGLSPLQLLTGFAAHVKPVTWVHCQPHLADEEAGRGDVTGPSNMAEGSLCLPKCPGSLLGRDGSTGYITFLWGGGDSGHPVWAVGPPAPPGWWVNPVGVACGSLSRVTSGRSGQVRGPFAGSSLRAGASPATESHVSCAQGRVCADREGRHQQHLRGPRSQRGPDTAQSVGRGARRPL